MTRGWTVTAAVAAFLHGTACLLGAVGMGLTADNAEPITTNEALGLAVLVAVTALATVVGGVLVLVWRPWPLLAAAGVSLAISAYVAVRTVGEPGAYQLPASFAVLPVVIVAVLVASTTAGRRTVAT